jgi:hypothetical protein
MGPMGKGGVYLVSTDGKIPVYGIVQNEKGKNIADALVISSTGVVLTKTNKCGAFFLPSFQIYEKLIVRKKGFEDVSIAIDKTELGVKLIKKRK